MSSLLGVITDLIYLIITRHYKSNLIKNFYIKISPTLFITKKKSRIIQTRKTLCCFRRPAFDLKQFSLLKKSPRCESVNASFTSVPNKSWHNDWSCSQRPLFHRRKHCKSLRKRGGRLWIFFEKSSRLRNGFNLNFKWNSLLLKVL